LGVMEITICRIWRPQIWPGGTRYRDGIVKAVSILFPGSCDQRSQE